MSLINCPECKNEISNKAEMCPNCGYPISKDDESVSTKNQIYENVKSKKHIFGWIVCIIYLLAFFINAPFSFKNILL